MHPAASGKAQLEQSVLQTVSQRKGGHTDETDPQTHRHYFTIDSSHPAPHHWGFVIYLTAAEFNLNPWKRWRLAARRKRRSKAGDSLRVLSYNIGYGSLDQTQDFFMDGGKKCPAGK